MKKVNYGCGDKKLPGYINVDIDNKGDIQADCLDESTFENDSIDEVCSYHLLEHLDRGGGERFIKNCHRMLNVGGRLIIEIPDLRSACRKVVAGTANLLTMQYIFGNQRNEYQFHYWGYTGSSIAALLKSNGFVIDDIDDGTDAHQQEEACLRIEATKI